MFDLIKDIEKALKTYANLRLDPETVTVSGKFIAFDRSSKIEIEEYDVIIRFPKDYPFRFPIVFESSEKIPRNLSRHINNQGNICFCNPQDELSLSRNGITFKWFLDEILNPHLCREYAREYLGYYPTGERSHGTEGIWEGYFDLFETTNKKTVLEELKMILNIRKPGRNSPCYCNSGRKYKTCHEKLEPEVMKVGRQNALKLYEVLKNDYEQHNKTV
jgi:hypothetical protein